MNPTDPKHIRRLSEAIRWSRTQLEPFRRERRQAIRQYVGKHYSSNGAGEKVPISLLKQALFIYQRSLVAQSPRAMIRTTRPNLMPVALAMETWLNHRLQEVNLVQVLRDAVLDALLCVGIVKTGVCYYKADAMLGTIHDFREPFVDTVSLDDWAHDMNARRLDQCDFMGHRFRASLDLVREEPAYDKKARESLNATEDYDRNERGDERTESLSRGEGGSGEESEAEEKVELWEIYLPRENLVVTLSANDQGSGPGETVLRVEDYSGPETGPYHMLSFGEVPDNIMPSSIAHDLIDLHESVNHLARKVIRQAEGQKFLLAVQGGATGDGKTMTDATDGTAVTIQNPAGAQEVMLGKFDPGTLALVIQLRDLFSRQAGNMEALGGLSPQAETLGQDQLLQASASKQVQDMQSRVVQFTQHVMKALAFYWWTDPERQYEVKVPIPKIDERFHPTMVIPPEMREGSWLELNFTIDPYSLQSESPSTKAQGLTNLLGLLFNAAPMLQQQQTAINFEEVIRELFRLMNMPDLADRFLVPAEPQPNPEQQELSEPPRMPASTNRTYTRVNRPGASDQGKDAAMIQMLMGAGGNPGETASIGRPTA